MSYVNLKDLAEFNKYTTGLGAGALVYVDKIGAGNQCIRTLGIILAAIVVVLGVIVMSVKGRIKGDDIDYAKETDPAKVSLFKVVSCALTIQMVILVLTICTAGWLSLAGIWGWK
jgi:Mn2+/Fe2+ NRAMP family transporter